MCGIAGIICLTKEKKILAPNIHRMAMEMKRRGPDDEGYLMVRLDKMELQSFIGNDTPKQSKEFKSKNQKHIKEAYTTKFNLAFGHRRLKILDLTFRGHQPMSSSDGRHWILFNGEVYNYKEIKKELGRFGHTFISNTDTEVVLHAYKEWGEDCLKRFNGMFAIVIYDHYQQEIFLARDRIGIKPLYYIHEGGLFIFASDIKTIIASGFYKPEVNWEGLWHNLSFFITPRPMTIFKNVYSIPQAHWLKIHIPTNRFILQQYWHIPINSQKKNITEQEALEQLDGHLKRSIQYRLEADVKVGTFMSGGIDSTTISAIASTLHPGINAFTLAFDQFVPEYAELDQAIATARMHPMNHIVDIVKPQNILADINDMVLGYEEPFCSLAPNYLISKYIAKYGIVVVLNGLGGDELFAGYSHYRNVNNWKWKKFIALFLPQGFHHAYRYRQLKSIDNYYVYQYSIFLEQDKKKLFLKDYGFDSLNILKKMYPPPSSDFSDDIEALSYYDLMSYIGNHHVYRIDQFTMRFSLEGRFPFLDHQLIEWSFQIPSHFKIKKNHPQFQKYILRTLAKKYIAPKCLKMPKRGFGLPVGRWMKKELKEFTENSLKNLKKREIFNNNEIDNLYHIFKQNPPQLYKKIWHLVMTELWFQLFID